MRFVITLVIVFVLAVVAQTMTKKHPKNTEFQFDVLTDSTILISGNNGDDWYTISSDSVRYFIIDNVY